jgi:DNA-binding transcriptional regulator YhcF (GntR family)
MCYTTDITQDTSRIQKQVKDMLIEVDFNSDEALYIQLQNQIILGIAMDLIKEGDALPSVRQMADLVGINMHTVNKAYTILKQEGFIRLDRRKGAVIALDIDKAQALLKMRENLRILLARGCCKNVSREEVHALVDDIFDEYGKE